MAKKSPHHEERPAEREGQCTYTSVKIDDELPPLVRRAAANAGISVQEYMSNVINAALLNDLGENITRRKPPRGK